MELMRRLGCRALLVAALLVGGAGPASAQVIVENTGTTSIVAPGNSIDVTKPSGLAVGDLMIAHVFFRNNTSSTFNSVASGFAEIRTDFAANVAHGAWWKIADASDVAASVFSFGIDGGAVNGIGRIWRISGHHASAPIVESNSATGTGLTITVGGITPAVADCLIVLLHGASDDTGSITGWAIATDDPGFDEVYDDNGSLSNVLIAAAEELRPQTTATGDATWTEATSESWGGIILAVRPFAAGTSSLTGSRTTLTGAGR